MGGSNRVFERLLALEAAAAAEAAEKGEQGAAGGGDRGGFGPELEMAKQCGEFIDAAVGVWLSDKAAPVSPTMPQILTVVGGAVAGMPVPAREDLLNFQNFVESDADAAAFR